MALGREIEGYENRARALPIRITGGGAAPVCVSRGVKSVSKTATGTLKVVLDQAFARLLMEEAWVEINGAVTTTIGDQANVDARNVTVDGSLIVYTDTGTRGTLADIANTRSICVELLVSESGV